VINTLMIEAVRTSETSVTLTMEAVRTFETSVYSNETTWRYSPETLIVILAAVRT
jgi:hypothetical protein